MQRVEEPPMETIHLYVVREEEPKLSLLPILLSVVALLCVVAVGMVLPSQQPETRTTIRVPAVLLPLRTFTTQVKIIPTGKKTYPATSAHGTLTITNGSIISQELPKGMILTGKDGSEVVTDTAVFVPAGSANGYGFASVNAHAVVAGAKGNIAELDIYQVEGSALYIRNLKPFAGGRDARTVKYISQQDRQRALSQARESLRQQTVAGLLERPCTEGVAGTSTVAVTWSCQFVRFDTPDLPGIRVLHATVAGESIILDIVYVARPRVFPGK